MALRRRLDIRPGDPLGLRIRWAWLVATNYRTWACTRVSASSDVWLHHPLKLVRHCCAFKQVRTLPFVFIPDEHDVSLLPSWVRAPTQITDSHLSKLATANGAVLGTLHENIPPDRI